MSTNHNTANHKHDDIGSGPEVVPGRFWHRLDDGRIQCDICPRACKMHEGQRGLCFVRAAKDRAADDKPRLSVPTIAVAPDEAAMGESTENADEAANAENSTRVPNPRPTSMFRSPTARDAVACSRSEAAARRQTRCTPG